MSSPYAASQRHSSRGTPKLAVGTGNTLCTFCFVGMGSWECQKRGQPGPEFAELLAQKSAGCLAKKCPSGPKFASQTVRLGS